MRKGFQTDPRIKGYLIVESSSVPTHPKILSHSQDGPVVIEAILQEADRPNRNKRNYPKKVLQEGLSTPYIQERLRTKTLFGEAGHPLKPDMERQLYIDQTRVSHIIREFFWDQNDDKILRGIIESAMTNVGRDFKGLISQGAKVAFSMRGVGPITENRKDYVEIKSPLTILTYDWVVHPSHEVAYMEKILSEETLAGLIPSSKKERKILSEGLIIPLQSEEIKDFIRHSSKNFRNIVEQFEIDPKAPVTVNEDRRTVTIDNKNEQICVFLEDYVSRAFDDFLLNL